VHVAVVAALRETCGESLQRIELPQPLRVPAARRQTAPVESKVEVPAWHRIVR
jgi:hypothetical protein